MTADWIVYDYEVGMFKSTLTVCTNVGLESYPGYIQNAIVESLLLHTRILADILLSRDSATDAISLKTLLPGFEPARLEQLKSIYGNRNIKDSPCWTLNKLFAHATSFRSDTFDYGPRIEELRQPIQLCLDEVESEREKGR